MDANELENEVIEIKTWLGQQMGYRQSHKGYIGRLLKELFTWKIKVDTSLDGSDEKMGMRTKMAIVWRSYMVLWGAFCAVAGFVLKDIIGKVLP